jgi:hypothetical protein
MIDVMGIMTASVSALIVAKIGMESPPFTSHSIAEIRTSM